MDKQTILDKIAREIDACDICKIDTIGIAVPGEGNSDADIMFVGEAPGKNEAREGRPFIGRSGKLLRLLIVEAGLREADVFIVSPVKYLPKRGTPNPKEIAHGRIHLSKQLAVIEPKVIVLLGSVAVQAVLGQKVPVLKVRGKIVEQDGRKYFITIHPAAALRFPKLKKLLLEDFGKLTSVIASKD